MLMVVNILKIILSLNKVNHVASELYLSEAVTGLSMQLSGTVLTYLPSMHEALVQTPALQMTTTAKQQQQQKQRNKTKQKNNKTKQKPPNPKTVVIKMY